MWNRWFIWPFDCLGVITATSLFGRCLIGSRAQPSGTRGKGEAICELWCSGDIIWDFWKRGLLYWFRHSGDPTGNFHSDPLISQPCGQGTQFRLLPVFWAHPSYTGSGASWLALPLAWKAGDLTCNCKAVGQPKACQVPVPLMRKAPDFGANCRVLTRVQTMWESSYRKPGFCTVCFLPKRNQI